MNPPTPPLAFSQQYLWLLLQYPDTGPARFNVNLVVELFGALDARNLEDALATLEIRHESLRTCVRIVKGRPVQVVGEPSSEPLPLLELSHLAKAERGAALDDLVREEERRPLDLVHGPPVRKRLVRLAADEHVLLWTSSHVNADAWSLRNLISELRELYSARAHGRPARLANLPIRYVDFARMQRTATPSPRNVSFWRNYLGDRACYQPPHRQPRPARPSPERTEWIPIPRGLNERIDAASRELSCSRFALFLTAFGRMAHRWSGETDVVALVASAQRSVNTEPLVGSFADVLPVRLNLPSDPMGPELVRATQTSLLAALIHELPLHQIEEATGRTYRFTFAITDHTPFEALESGETGEADPTRSHLQRPDAFPMACGPMADIQLRALHLPMRLYRMDLVFILRSDVVGCTYQPDLFTVDTIRQAFQWLLEALDLDTAARVGER